jgi:hypothetical protein
MGRDKVYRTLAAIRDHVKNTPQGAEIMGDIQKNLRIGRLGLALRQSCGQVWRDGVKCSHKPLLGQSIGGVG